MAKKPVSPAIPKTLTAEYEPNAGQLTIAATGAYGGPAPDNSAVVAHLFVEYVTVPSVEQYDIEEGGFIDFGKPTGQAKGSMLTRRVVASLLLPPESALRIGEFLVEKAHVAIRNRAKMQASAAPESKKAK